MRIIRKSASSTTENRRKKKVFEDAHFARFPCPYRVGEGSAYDLTSGRRSRFLRIVRKSVYLRMIRKSVR